jgi:hypothetical protein
MQITVGFRNVRRRIPCMGGLGLDLHAPSTYLISRIWCKVSLAGRPVLDPAQYAMCTWLRLLSGQEILATFIAWAGTYMNASGLPSNDFHRYCQPWTMWIGKCR